MRIPTTIAFLGTALAVTPALHAQRQMERLGRGVLVLRNSSSQTYIGWRLLGNDPEGLAFNLYRSADGAAPVKVNSSPLANTTDYVDNPPNLGTVSYTYSVRPVIAGAEVPDVWAHPSAPAGATLPAGSNNRQYLPVPLQPPTGGANADYSVKFAWVGDLDGDGEYDFVVERTPSTADAQWIQAYKRDGTLLWQMSQGPNSIERDNIYPGSSAIAIGHNDNVTVYDMDGDGKAEVCVLTANGVVFANGTTLSAPDDEVQFISIIDGETGAEKARGQIPIPPSWTFRENVTGHFGILYSDGVRPSLIFQASNRNPSTLHFSKYATAWDYRDGAISMRWIYDFETAADHVAEGHQIRLADVDNDGRDEYVDIGHVVKADGSGQINGDKLNDIVHGDRFHVTDIDPDRPGLETYVIQQNNGTGLATALFAADKSETIRKWYAGSVVDVGRGTIGGFVPGVNGLQVFSTMAGVFDCKGDELYSSQPWPVETIWWDADAGREFLTAIGSSATSPGIDKFNTSNGSSSRIISLYSDSNAPNSPYNNYIAYGARPQFWGDIIGDWREELVCMASDNSELRVYTTRTPDSAKSFDGLAVRIPTLMHDPQYRIQTTTKGYVQSSYPGYYLGYNMPPPPPSPMVDVDLVWSGGPGTSTWDNGTTSAWKNGTTSAPAVFSSGKSVRFDLTGNHASAVALNGTLTPGDVTVYSPSDHTFDGSSGSLAGGMKLLKSGRGGLRVTGSHSFTGATTVWDGALRVDGALAGTPVTIWGGTWGGAAAKGLTGGRLAGSGSVSTPVTLRYRGAVTPGAGMNSAGTLAVGGLDARDGSALAFDLANTPGGASDLLTVSGNLSFSGTVHIRINPLSGTLAPGTYTLATYTGALTGSTANLKAEVPAGTPYQIQLGSGSLRLVVPTTRPAGSVTWQGGLNGNVWDLANTANWRNGGTPDIFVTGDNVAFDDSSSATPDAVLQTAVTTGNITVSGSAGHTISGTGSINGAGGLTKSGTGTLTLLTTNGYTGPTIVQGGILAIGNLGDGGAPSSIGSSSGDAANLVLNGGTLRLDGPQTNTNRSFTIGSSGAGIDIPAGKVLQISGEATGSGALTKAGGGTLIFAGANSHGGGTVVSNGVLSLFSDTANVSGLGSGGVTLAGGTLRMYNNTSTSSWATSSWPIHVPAGNSGRIDADGRCKLTGALTGGGDFTFHTPYVRTDVQGNWSAFTGRILIISDGDGGDFRFEHSAGFPSAALDLGAGVYAVYNKTMSSDLTIPVGNLSGNADSVLRGGLSSGRTVTYQVGARNEDGVFDGRFTNNTGPTALEKTGAGTLTLGGANNHTGATTVSGGRLRITGSSGGSNFTVAPGGMLGGTGTITGNVTVQSGGGLEWSASPLAVTGNVTLAGTVIVAPAAGLVPAEGTYTILTYTGSLGGSPSFSWSPPPGSTTVATFSTATPGQVVMTLETPPRLPGTVVWTGATNQTWDTATANWSSGGGAVTFLNGDTATFTDAGNAASPVSLAATYQPAALIADASQAYTLAGPGAIGGEASLSTLGSGALTLAAANSYTGGTTIGGGATLVLGRDASGTTGGLGTGAVVLRGTLGHAFSTDNTLVYSEEIHIPSGASGRMLTPTRFRLNGPVTGPGALEIAIDSSIGRADLQNDFSGFTGALRFTGSGGIRLGIRGLASGQPNANGGGFANCGVSFDGPSLSVNTYSSGSTVVLGALSSTGDAGTLGGGTAGTARYQIGGLGTHTTYGGGITGNASLTKEGAGSLALTHPSNLTYSGPTTVSAGSLLIHGVKSGTGTTGVAAGATLGGTGTIAGAVSCDGTLAPGPGAGTLSLTGGLALSSSSLLAFELGASSDRVAVTGNLTLDGTLDVSAGAGFTPGTHTLVTYTGSLTDNTLLPGNMPAGYAAQVDTSLAGQVRLVVTSLNAAPVITAGPSAPAAATVGAGVPLSVTASDDAGEPALAYTWSASGPASVAITPNGTNAAKSATATFPATGSYQITVTVTDAGGLTDQETVDITIGKATATIQLAGLSAIYDGAAKPVTAGTDPAGLDVEITYDGADGAPVAPGSYAVAATIDDPAYQGSTGATLVIAPRSYQDWIPRNFSAAQILAGDSALSADPDRDGLSNLAEYALGGDPWGFTPQPAAERTPAGLVLTFLRPAHIGDVDYHAEFSDGLGTWDDLPLEITDPGADPETVRASLPMTAPSGAGFLRLRFTSPQPN